MIQIKRAYDPPGPEDGVRYLVDRLWPRGVAPLGFAHPTPVVVDESLSGPVVGGGGREDLLIRIAVDDLVRVNGARRAAICQTA